MIKNFFKVALWVSPLAGLVSCLFDSTGFSGEKAWFDANGLPVSYQVQTLDVEGFTALSASVGFDSIPTIQTSRIVLGAAEGIDQALVFDFIFRDESFFTKIKTAGVAANANLTLHLDSSFYSSIGSGRLPLADGLQVRYTWTVANGLGASFLDSIGSISDSIWLNSWKKGLAAVDSADTSFTLATTVARDSLALPLPAKLVGAILSATDGQRLQLKVSLVDASQILRLRSIGWNNYSIPLLKLKADTVSKNVYAYRLAQQSRLTQVPSADNLVLHGGIRESLLVEFDATPVLQALTNFYGDEFPLADQADVRQTVVMAEMAIPRTALLDGSELGHPIPVFASSLVDSLKDDGSFWNYAEGYKLDSAANKVNGHSNLLFFAGDSLKIQVTGILRSFINTAGLQSSTFKVALRMGRPMLAPYSVYYYDYYNADGTYVSIFSDNSAFSSYDFSAMLQAGAPVRLKLWLSSARGSEQ